MELMKIANLARQKVNKTSKKLLNYTKDSRSTWRGAERAKNVRDQIKN